MCRVDSFGFLLLCFAQPFVVVGACCFVLFVLLDLLVVRFNALLDVLALGF